MLATAGVLLGRHIRIFLASIRRRSRWALLLDHSIIPNRVKPTACGPILIRVLRLICEWLRILIVILFVESMHTLSSRIILWIKCRSLTRWPKWRRMHRARAFGFFATRG